MDRPPRNGPMDLHSRCWKSCVGAVCAAARAQRNSPMATVAERMNLTVCVLPRSAGGEGFVDVAKACAERL